MHRIAGGGQVLPRFVFQNAACLRRASEGLHVFERQGVLSALSHLPDVRLRMYCVLRAVKWNRRRRSPFHVTGFPLPNDRLCMCHSPHPFHASYAHIIAHKCRYGKSFVSKRRFSSIIKKQALSPVGCACFHIYSRFFLFFRRFCITSIAAKRTSPIISVVLPGLIISSPAMTSRTRS